MSIFYISFGVAILSSVLYHVFQRAISPQVNPVVSLLVTYVTAFAGTLTLLFLFPLRRSIAQEVGQVNWASIALGIAIVGLEIGFLLAYRAGWRISVTGIATNVAAALVLVPTGILLFRERPTTINLLGVLVSIFGLVMINYRK